MVLKYYQSFYYAKQKMIGNLRDHPFLLQNYTKPMKHIKSHKYKVWIIPIDKIYKTFIITTA